VESLLAKALCLVEYAFSWHFGVKSFSLLSPLLSNLPSPPPPSSGVFSFLGGARKSCSTSGGGATWAVKRRSSSPPFFWSHQHAWDSYVSGRCQKCGRIRLLHAPLKKAGPFYRLLHNSAQPKNRRSRSGSIAPSSLVSADLAFSVSSCRSRPLRSLPLHHLFPLRLLTSRSVFMQFFLICLHPLPLSPPSAGRVSGPVTRRSVLSFPGF